MNYKSTGIWVVLEIRVTYSVPNIVRHPRKGTKKGTLIERTSHVQALGFFGQGFR